MVYLSPAIAGKRARGRKVSRR